jgi:type I restriction-modification system DNA methylase subunit
LEQAFIQPVFEELGWKLKYQTFLQNRKPDYALFLDDASLDAALRVSRNSPEFWHYPKIVADAKAWHVSLDRPSYTQNEREYPPQQIEWYLDRSRLDFGILTNGKLWRLVPREYRPQQRRFQTYLECDLPAILEGWLRSDDRFHRLDEFLHFFLFFSPHGFETTEGRKPLVERAVEGSSEYRLGVGEGLKERAFEALRLAIEGFLTYQPNGLRPESDLELCRQESFILLYRLLFVMYAEDRRLLPYRINRLYTNNRSLARHRDDIAGRLDQIQSWPDADYSRDTADIWSDLIDLWDLIDRGHRTYQVPAYDGGLFDAEAHPFLSQKKLPDWYLARVIDQLGRAADQHRPQEGLARVDYRDLAIQHLGNIYEGLLELHPHHASERMIVISRRVQGRLEERIIPAAASVPAGFDRTDISYRPGTIYLQTDKGERRATGSYYTPDHIVNHIVEYTLGPTCKRLSEQLEREIKSAERELRAARGDAAGELTERLQKLRGDFDERVLQLRVVDPAIGSGHFLIRACQYLAEEIATHPFTGEESGNESALAHWKRRVAERCLYGVDMNPLAVELAKLALWLETVAADRPLTFLDHHLRYGNSLIGAKIAELEVLPGEGELPTIPFAQKVEQQLPALLRPLAEIRQLPSENAEQIKSKARLYRNVEKAREALRCVADIWCSIFAAPPDQELPQQGYQRAIELLDQPINFRKLAAEPWFQAAIQLARKPEMACFHWELEFPEVFFGDTGHRADAGFDVVIGNPPYDVLSEKETGRDLSALRAFIEAQPIYAPSRRGKNNLYKLFICRALDLLADRGMLGFITPMAVLGDDQAAEIRRKIIEVGSFADIQAFPQKDDPDRRVFPEAKLSTAVFTLRKGNPPDTEAQPFTSRVHPGRFLEPDSPSLTLSTAAIPLYDPANLTIVSCGQKDWDLATRIMASERVARLGDVTTSFQGEVNETNDRSVGRISYNNQDGPEVIRGAHLCLYAIREASQGTAVFLKVDRFLDRARGTSPDAKAYHHRQRRVGFQRKSPQNNFRRLIAAPIAAGTFLLESISYVPAHKSEIPLEFVLAILNSKLADWFFRLGSTNAMVGEYQYNNLPCPRFADAQTAADRKLEDKARDALRDDKLDRVLELLEPALSEPPFSLAVRNVLIEAVKRIIAQESERGDIPRTARSALDPAAQSYQDLIDRLLYRMAGLTDAEAKGLEARLAEML